MENQELQVVEKTTELTPELLVIAETSGLVLTEAQEIGIRFAPFMNVVNDFAVKIAEINSENPTAEDAKLARTCRLALVSNRGSKGLSATKEELKAGLLIKTRLIDSYFKVVENSSLLSEQKAEAIENHQKKIEEQRLSDLEQSRIELLSPYGEINKFVDLKNMDDATFDSYLQNEALAFNTRKENERLAEAKRLEEEKKAEEDRIAAEKKAEHDRLKKEAEDKAEKERIEKENAELKAQQEKREAEIADQNRVAKIEQDEKDRLSKIESDKNAKIQANLKAENDRVNAELKAKKNEEERVASEKLAQEKALLNAGDKEKVKIFFGKFDSLVNEFPNLSTTEGKAMQARVIESLLMVKKLIISDSKTLL